MWPIICHVTGGEVDRVAADKTGILSEASSILFSPKWRWPKSYIVLIDAIDCFLVTTTKVMSSVDRPELCACLCISSCKEL